MERCPFSGDWIESGFTVCSGCGARKIRKAPYWLSVLCFGAWMGSCGGVITAVEARDSRPGTIAAIIGLTVVLVVTRVGRSMARWVWVLPNR